MRRRQPRHGNPGAPMVTPEPRAAAANFAIKVAGGHTIKSALPANARGAGDDSGELAFRGGEPVHLPVARHQGRMMAAAMF